MCGASHIDLGALCGRRSAHRARSPSNLLKEVALAVKALGLKPAIAEGRPIRVRFRQD
jgi:hypothetical protein